MPPFVEIASITEIPPGGAKAFIVGGREIAVFHVGGHFYAIDNSCPHQGGPLAEGWLDGCLVTCPWHAWCFDVTTGKMTLGFSTVETFEVQVVGSTISVATEPRS
jgi:nitrite reductase/ring-hydroxylating ferredoxin subunit